MHPPIEITETDLLPFEQAMDQQDLSGVKKHPQWQYHRAMLVMALCVIALAFALRVRSDQLVEFRFWPGHPLPETCSAKRTLGIDCAGCGLTRSFVYLAHGDIAASLAIHPLGWTLALFTLFQLPYRLWSMRDPDVPPLGKAVPWSITIGLLLMLWGRWMMLWFSGELSV